MKKGTLKQRQADLRERLRNSGQAHGRTVVTRNHGIRGTKTASQRIELRSFLDWCERRGLEFLMWTDVPSGGSSMGTVPNNDVLAWYEKGLPPVGVKREAKEAI